MRQARLARFAAGIDSGGGGSSAAARSRADAQRHWVAGVRKACAIAAFQATLAGRTAAERTRAELASLSEQAAELETAEAAAELEAVQLEKLREIRDFAAFEVGDGLQPVLTAQLPQMWQEAGQKVAADAVPERFREKRQQQEMEAMLHEWRTPDEIEELFHTCEVAF